MATCVGSIQEIVQPHQDIEKLEFYLSHCGSNQLEELIDRLGYVALDEENLDDLKNSIQKFTERNSIYLSEKKTQEKVEIIFDAIRTAFFSVLEETTDFQNLFERLKEMLTPFQYCSEDHQEAIKRVIVKRVKVFHYIIPELAVIEYMKKKQSHLNLNTFPDSYQDRSLNLSPFTEFFGSFV